MALSDVKVRSAKPEAKAYKLTDGEGMVLLVHPNGSKYWRLRYRFSGKEKMLALGKYPEVSLADARARRDEARKLLANSIDPSENKKAVKVEQEQEAMASNDCIVVHQAQAKITIENSQKPPLTR
ncbi:Prophage integrase IntA [Klebsiella oxytoca]|nr:Prophage integrase IntA [Klebsiella oxytoca]CAH5760399.1 Prophage integrase IntA [Klebsiella oxytoca]